MLHHFFKIGSPAAKIVIAVKNRNIQMQPDLTAENQTFLKKIVGVISRYFTH
ncbi:hypothetical protein [Larkinella sp. C7]|uniref:hypothetical protein n=1 Tax=Larkinella sp. C7 TaxID=2576607 RepID=UPI001486CC9A|nr:hypothetical protein [Larkinella sp. C7]